LSFCPGAKEKDLGTALFFEDPYGSGDIFAKTFGNYHVSGFGHLFALGSSKRNYQKEYA
jgi:hypothetical protein